MTLPNVDARRSAMNEVDAEIEARKASLQNLREDHARRHDGHPDIVPPPPATPAGGEAGRRQSATPWEQAVLDAAAKMYNPGDVAYPARIATDLGVPPGRVSVATTALRVKGLWPYAPCGNLGRGRSKGGEGPDADQAGQSPRAPGQTSLLEQMEEPDLARLPANFDSKAGVDDRSHSPLPARSGETATIRNSDPETDPELLVIRRMLAQLGRLPTWASKIRVLEYLRGRMEEEGEVR